MVDGIPRRSCGDRDELIPPPRRLSGVPKRGHHDATISVRRPPSLDSDRAFASTALLAALLAAPVPSIAATLDQPLLVVTGDFDGDNLSDRVQGFPEASDGAGRVDVFWGDEAFKVAWPTVLSAVKTPSSRLIGGRLGESLAVGDFDGDGFDDLALGAPHANASDPVCARRHSGSVVVIYGCGVPACQAVTARARARQPWARRSIPTISAGAQRITASPAVDFGRFGKSLAAGDFDDDGYDDLAIGAPGDTVGNAAGAGSVTVISGSASGLDLATRRLLASGRSSGGRFTGRGERSLRGRARRHHARSRRRRRSGGRRARRGLRGRGQRRRGERVLGRSRRAPRDKLRCLPPRHRDGRREPQRRSPGLRSQGVRLLRRRRRPRTGLPRPCRGRRLWRQARASHRSGRRAR